MDWLNKADYQCLQIAKLVGHSMGLQLKIVNSAQVDIEGAKLDFPNWGNSSMTFEDSEKGRLQAHMLISLLTRINVGLPCW